MPRAADVADVRLLSGVGSSVFVQVTLSEKMSIIIITGSLIFFYTSIAFIIVVQFIFDSISLPSG